MAKLRDGFKTLVSFSLNPAYYAEIEVGLPGVDKGGMIPQDSMRNTLWRTKIGKALRDLTEFTVTISWDPYIYALTSTVLGNQLVTITFPDGSTLAFWADVNKFQPGPNKEGERPTATLTIIPTNLNSSCVETGPVFTTGSTSPCL
jgi:hypothetical protein